MPRIAVIGTTTWGATLGAVWAYEGMNVRLWGRTDQEVTELKKPAANRGILPGIDFPSRLSVTSSMRTALAGADAVVMAVPSQSMRRNMQRVSEHLDGSMLVVNTAKGLEVGSNKRMSTVMAEEMDADHAGSICVLSGPNLSVEILNGLPAATVVAAGSETVCRRAQKLLTTRKLCVYHNTDVIGVELGGAIKNVIALAAGVVDGLGYGDNAKAALITRGLAEMTALGVALGANPLTFSGLAGLGDLMATCASTLSRNHHVGLELAKGRLIDDIVRTMTGVAEGVSTTTATWSLAHELGVEMPITEKMHSVLGGVDVRTAAVELMGAQARHELAGRRWMLFSAIRRSKRNRSVQPAGG
jgi:glycerol-3-phosphate dehydrogenase (NAD(P)+)